MWENHRKNVGKSWKTCGKIIGNMWENHKNTEKNIGNKWENHRKNVGTSWKYGNIIGKKWENHRKYVGKS